MKWSKKIINVCCICLCALSFIQMQNATKRHAYLNSFSTGPQSAKYGINQFSDLSQKEFRGRLKSSKCVGGGGVVSRWAALRQFNMFHELRCISIFSSVRLLVWSDWARTPWIHTRSFASFISSSRFALSCICSPQICTCERALTKLLSSLD